MSTTLTAEDTKKLKRIVDEGLKLTQEIKDLKEGFRDTVKAVAEELDIKPASINKAIRTAFKASLEAEKESVTEIEEILALVGRA
jgi:transposase-like protein